MKRLMSLILLAALLLGAFPQPALASSGYALVSNTTRLNIRSGPGSGYPVIGSVSGGQWVDVDTVSGSWVQGTSLQDGRSGWFSASFLKMAQAGAPTPGSVVVVNNPTPSSFLNLRQAPSYVAPVLGIFYNGASGIYLSQTDGWYEVEISGMHGYFRSEFLRMADGPGPIGTARIHSGNGGSVNLRSGPSLSLPVIGRGSPGTTVTVYLKGSKFWYISMAGTFGFMDAAYLSTGGSNPDPNPPIVIPPETNAIVTNTGKNLNLREQPSTSSRVLGSYPGETAIRILSQGLNWSRVTVPLSGKTGYMMTRYLTLYGLPASPTRRVSHPAGTYVNLRTKPSVASGSVSTRVPHGSTVTILVAGGEWAQVRYNGTEGYMMTAFLK